MAGKPFSGFGLRGGKDAILNFPGADAREPTVLAGFALKGLRAVELFGRDEFGGLGNASCGWGLKWGGVGQGQGCAEEEEGEREAEVHGGNMSIFDCQEIAFLTRSPETGGKHMGSRAG